MRFLVDECAGPAIAHWLRSRSHEVYSVYEEARGMADTDVLQKAFSENWILITNDKDFGELVFRFRFLPKGVLLLRLKDESAKNKVKIITFIIREHLDQLAGNYLIVTEKQIRKRSIVK